MELGLHHILYIRFIRLFMIYVLVGSDYQAFWMRLYIKPMSVPHGDLQALVAAIQCMAQGIDPIVSNPCDIGGRGLLLPRTWLSFGYFGLSADNIHLWAFFFIAQFGGALFLLFHSQKGKDLIWVALLVFSPPVLLAVERVEFRFTYFWMFGRRRLFICCTPTFTALAFIDPYFLCHCSQALSCRCGGDVFSGVKVGAA